MDARVGGEYEFRYYWAAKDLHSTAKGKILELVPDRRLSYTFNSDRGGSASVLTWTLDELQGGRTRVTLVHSGLGDAPSDQYSGWGYFLGRLAVHCAKMAVRA